MDQLYVQQYLVSSSTATTPGTKEEHNGTYFIEMLSHSYIFQDRGLIKGKHGAEGGWKHQYPTNVVYSKKIGMHRVESGSDDPDNVGHLGHFFDGSIGSHLQTKLSGCEVN